MNASQGEPASFTCKPVSTCYWTLCRREAGVIQCSPIAAGRAIGFQAPLVAIRPFSFPSATFSNTLLPPSSSHLRNKAWPGSSKAQMVSAFYLQDTKCSDLKECNKRPRERGSGDVKNTTRACNTDHAGQRGPSSPLPCVRETVSWLVLSFLMDTEELEEFFRKTREKGEETGPAPEVHQKRALLGELSMTSQETVPELPPSNSFLEPCYLHQTAKDRAGSQEGSESSPSPTTDLGETAPFSDLAQESRPRLGLLTFHEDTGGQKSKKSMGPCSHSRGTLHPGPRFPNVCLEF